MKKLLFFAVICLPLLFTGCEKRIIDTTVTIYGSVYDATTHAPIQGIKLSLQPSLRSCYTGSDGMYNFEVNLEPAIYTVTAWDPNEVYRADNQSVKLTAGESAEANFALKKY